MESPSHASAKILFDAFTEKFISEQPPDKSWISSVINNDLAAVKKGLKKANTGAVYQDHISLGTTWSPLHAAAFQGHVKVAEALIEYGADIEAQDGVYQGVFLTLYF